MNRDTASFLDKVFNVLKLSSIKRKFIALFVVSSIVPIIVLGAWSYSSAARSVEEQFTNSSIMLLDRIGANLDLIFQQLTDLAAAVSRNSVLLNAIDEEKIQSVPSMQITDEINYYVKRLNIPVKVLILFKDGNYFSNYGHTPAEMAKGIVNISESEWYKAIDSIDSKIKFIGLKESYFPGYETRYHLYFYKNIQFSNSENSGIVIVDFGAYLVDRLLGSMAIGKEDRVFLLDENSSVISVSTEDRKNKYTDIEKLYAQLTGNSGSFNTMTGRQKSIISFTTLKYNKWKLVRITDEQLITRKIIGIPLFTVFLIALLILIEMGLYIIVNATITRPITQLSFEMKKVEKGSFDTSIVPGTSDEIGMLAKGFNSMTAEIRNLVRKVVEDEMQANELEFALLQAQINPHFLYNTLNSIKQMAELADAANVGDAVASLIGLLKYAISDRHERVSLGTEMEYIQSYVQLSNIRFNNKIVLINRIQEIFKGHEMLKFTLQPLVENSIIHGLKFRKGIGTIIIDAFYTSESFNIIVRDNGVGIAPEVSVKLLLQEEISGNVNMTHIGLKSVDRRIKLHYGDKYGLSINSSPGEWTEVTLILPAEGGGLNEANDCG